MKRNNLDKKIKELKSKNLAKNFQVSFSDIIKYLNRAKKELIIAHKNIKIDKNTSCVLIYQSMLKVGRCLMFSYHLRPIDGSQHKTTIEFCEVIIGEKFRQLIESFDELRKKRNKFVYDVTEVEISDSELNYYFKEAQKLIELVDKIIKHKNPQKELL